MAQVQPTTPPIQIYLRVVGLRFLISYVVLRSAQAIFWPASIHAHVQIGLLQYLVAWVSCWFIADFSLVTTGIVKLVVIKCLGYRLRYILAGFPITTCKFNFLGIEWRIQGGTIHFGCGYKRTDTRYEPHYMLAIAASACLYNLLFIAGVVSLYPLVEYSSFDNNNLIIPCYLGTVAGLYAIINNLIPYRYTAKKRPTDLLLIYLFLRDESPFGDISAHLVKEDLSSYGLKTLNIPDLEKLLAKHPKSFSINLCLAMLNPPEKKLPYYQTALKTPALGPYTRGLALYGYLSYLLQENKLALEPQAENLAKELIPLDWKSATVLGIHGGVLVRLGRFREAKPILLKALSKSKHPINKVFDSYFLAAIEHNARDFIKVKAYLDIMNKSATTEEHRAWYERSLKELSK